MANSKLFDRYKVYEKEEIVQGTQEWNNVRTLKFTASKADAIAGNGTGLDTLVKTMLSEHYSSQEFSEYLNRYKNENMQRGNDYEAMARTVYEFETGNTVKEVGFIERSDYIGCSPDGLVTPAYTKDGKGLIEIKNHSDKTFLELLLYGVIDPKYIKQMQYQLWTTEYDWCDYFGFNPNFSPNFYMQRIYPDATYFKQFEIGVASGISMIQNGLDILDGKLKTNKKRNEEVKTETITISEDFPF